MATAAPVGSLFTGDDNLEPHLRSGYRQLGFWNGLLIGLALALGSWGLDAWRSTIMPSTLGSTSPLLSGAIVLAVCAFVGWLTARLSWNWFTILAWFGVGVLAALFIGYQPYLGRTLSVWLADSRFWGVDVFPLATGSRLGLIFGGLVVIITLTVFGILQGYRLELAVGELKPNGRFSLRSWLILLVPFPFVFLAAFVTNAMQINPAAKAMSLVYEGIEVARTYEGDLFQVGLERGSNFAALRGVREELSEAYSLNMGEIDSTLSLAFVLAEFDDGTWINCRVMNDQLSFCFDAAPYYEIGLANLVSGEPPPGDCPNCVVQATDEWRTWLAQRAAQLGPQPQMERLAQWGGYVLMRVRATTGEYAIDCWFNKMSPITLERCEEVRP